MADSIGASRLYYLSNRLNPSNRGFWVRLGIAIGALGYAASDIAGIAGTIVVVDSTHARPTAIRRDEEDTIAHKRVMKLRKRGAVRCTDAFVLEIADCYAA